MNVEGKTEKEVYECLVDKEVIGKMVKETNDYAEQYFAAHPNLPKRSRVRKWKPVTDHEMEKWIATTFLCALNSRPRLNQQWSRHRLYASGIFSAIMPRDR